MLELRPYASDDLWLTEALECDPRVMTHLGGPQPREKIPATHARRAAFVAGGGWYFTLVPDAAAGAIGTVGVWESKWRDETISEMGWMILPAFQGRGYASAAAQLVLERARSEKKFASVHAFPAVSNAASNAICRKAGFSRIEECDVEYDGRPLRCNHWRLELGSWNALRR